jgi:hypothetical protein
MLEDQRYDLSNLRDELRETNAQAERLLRTLSDLGMLLPVKESRQQEDTNKPT